MNTPDARPLVAVVCRVPLVSEALKGAFDGIARVLRLPAGAPDLPGLVRSLGADALVVDSAAAVEVLAEGASVPLVHLDLRGRRVRLLRGGEWSETTDDSIPSIRNLLVSALIGKEPVA